MNAQHAEAEFAPPPLIGSSPCIQEMLERLPHVARAQRTTLISGPTGSGKDVVARCLHSFSPRRSGPYVTVHCAALPETLVEAEMFGHSRGAFTGATQPRGGLVRSARSGTLFLDEIDSLPTSAQAKLLRFLETGEYRAVGSDHLEYSDAWVIAATNQNLADRVRDGAFRADLMFRLAVMQVPVPSLRQRSGDIVSLAEHFLHQIDAGKSFDAQAVQAMLSYDWPGNVRELKHRVESAALLTQSPTIDLRALHFDEAARAQSAAADFDPLEEMPAATPIPEQLEGQLWGLIDGGLTLMQAIGECERLMVRAALRAENNNRTRAAGRLGIHVRTIFKKLRP